MDYLIFFKCPRTKQTLFSFQTDTLRQANPFQMCPNFARTTTSNNTRPEQLKRAVVEPTDTGKFGDFVQSTSNLSLEKGSNQHGGNEQGPKCPNQHPRTRNLSFRTADFAARKQEDTTCGPTTGDGRRFRPKS